MKQTEDVIEAGSELHTQYSALGPMLIVLSIRKDVELQYRKTFA
jgi:hypothetical protein